nr:RusA family crossover junction endodeoxyribonuclease [uncultured Celeribacter sp.]
MEPDFPLEFIVLGTPVSLQRANKKARDEWKKLVKAASKDTLPQNAFLSEDPISITLYYYPENRMVGDVDNIVKLTVDAMCKHIFLDDDQVERIVVQKFEGDRVFAFSDPSEVLAECMLGDKPALYVRVSNDPHEEFRI